jgi:hypothetical protein
MQMKNSSIIDRAARALAKAQSGADDWDSWDEQLREQVRGEVRVVLEAVREPSEVMLIDPLPGFGQAMRGIWQGMIDLALDGERRP